MELANRLFIMYLFEFESKVMSFIKQISSLMSFDVNTIYAYILVFLYVVEFCPPSPTCINNKDKLLIIYEMNSNV